MYKSMFTLSDTADIEEKFEGYTDGSLWNGWANVLFTKEQACEFLATMPYDFKFRTVNNIPTLTIFWEDGEETYQSSPIPTDDGDILVGYPLEGLEFMEVYR